MNTFLSLVGSVSYIMLFFLHFFLREKVKKDYMIEGNFGYDFVAIICSTCGLAQEYREYEIVMDV
jgi:Cys-rich protein (TIGR01571 family)